MTIHEVTKTLVNCSNSNCFECKYIDIRDGAGYSNCQGHLIEDMANECRSIEAEMEDDMR